LGIQKHPGSTNRVSSFQGSKGQHFPGFLKAGDGEEKGPKGE